jgi:hypothetical protein
MWTVIDIDEDFQCSLMNAEGETREDLNLNPEKYDFHKRIMTVFEEEGEMEVKVTSAIGRDMIFLSTGGS